MLERVIENWLDKATERSFQQPFCYMLSAEGHTIIHLTRHDAMEMGKDIITIAPDGTPCAFQLKTGNISLSKWDKEVSSQTDALVTRHINHSSVVSSKYHRSYLVTNGNIGEKVSRAIHDRNQAWAQQSLSDFHLQTIVRGELLQKAKKLGTDLWPTELKDIKTLLEMFLEGGRGVLPKEKLASLFESTFPLSPLNNHRKPPTSHITRVIASAALLCAVATSSFSNENNYAAEIEAWTMYIAYVLALAERWDIHAERYKDSFDIAVDSIYNSLVNLSDEIRKRKHFLEPPALSDLYIYPVRLTWLLALMSIFALWRLSKELPKDEIDTFLQDFFETEFGQLELWGEAAIPQFLAVFWYWRKIDATRVPEDFLYCLISTICRQNGPNSDSSLASPYYEAEDVLPHILGVSEEPLRDSFSGASYALEGLVHLYVRRNWKQSMKLLWPSITKLANVRFEPANKWDFYRWRNEEGTHKIVYPKHTQEWEELKALSFESEGPNFPSSIKNHPILLLLFLCVYPHRMNAEMVRWLDTKIKQIPRA